LQNPGKFGEFVGVIFESGSHMLQQFWQLCTSSTSLFWIIVGSDLAIAVAYFAIPLTMAVVLRHRKEDIPYPWLWILFVTFIIACGITHVVHVISAVTGTEYLGLQATVCVLTAMASVGTAVAFAFVLPQIKLLPSPRVRSRELETLVAERTKEKDQLILEINHRVGNQLQILSSLVRIESRKTESEEALAVLGRIKEQLDQMSEQHLKHADHNFLSPARAEERFAAG
jgi:hypothetical protein